ncbi:phospholipase A [Halomonas sp. SSL-5]|uniref:phospholipase A n=1 Tax=Halomonas sp. SSL-5 TaxID=3065855 RepID=UPI00273908F1|nr:phospholipase A [Halomonas sp. SSL-5]MDY7115398.1 phospholipase A [Halomonas sp. SSL-5]
MRLPIRTAALAALSLLAAGMAQAEPAETERAALEARLAELRSEAAALQAQLEALEPAPGDATARSKEFPGEFSWPLAPGDVAVVEAAGRRQLEQASNRNPYAITAYRRNYLFPLTYNRSPNHPAYADLTGQERMERSELKFQFSAKVALAEGLFGNAGDLYFAYTQRSWWQAYNTDDSSPFRETNYEPEIFLNFDNDWQLLGWANIRNRVAINHQSNGRSNELSRSWNRLYLETIFQRGDWAVSLAPHYRLPETTGDDDNPDIERFMGYGDVTLARRFGDNELSLMVRGNPGAGHMGGQFDYSWPLFDSKVRAHVQYYHGYGESLIDYDHNTQRLSLGFSLNPLFSPSSGLLR